MQITLLLHIPTQGRENFKQLIINRPHGPLPSRPNPSAKNIKQKRDRDQRNSNETKHTGRPVHAQIMKHGIREQRKATSEQTPKESIRCHRAGCKLLKRIDQIVQRSLENSKEAESHHYSTGIRTNPVDIRCAGPSKNE